MAASLDLRISGRFPGGGGFLAISDRGNAWGKGIAGFSGSTGPGAQPPKATEAAAPSAWLFTTLRRRVPCFRRPMRQIIRTRRLEDRRCNRVAPFPPDELVLPGAQDGKRAAWPVNGVESGYVCFGDCATLRLVLARGALRSQLRAAGAGHYQVKMTASLAGRDAESEETCPHPFTRYVSVAALRRRKPGSARIDTRDVDLRDAGNPGQATVPYPRGTIVWREGAGLA
jgi:hypothetical protein